jgi:hypothetical protein
MFPDPTMCFTALIHLQAGGHFLHPKDITSNLAKLTWAIRLAMIYEVHGMLKADSSLEFLDAFEQVKKYTQEHQATTFASVRSLQHFATHISESTLAPPKLWWSDNTTFKTMRYEGKSLALMQLQDVFTSLEARLVKMWQTDVLKGAGVYAEYEELADNLRETRPGYSCFQDPDNHLDLQKGKLYEAILTNTELAKQFLLPARQGSGQPELNMLACRKWLFSLAEFEKMLMLSIEMTSGAPARGTELTSMLACNTSLRQRNVMALGKFMSIVRQYDKTTNNVQGDRLIPHALGAVNSDLLIQLHVLARPLAQVRSQLISAYCPLN